MKSIIHDCRDARKILMECWQTNRYDATIPKVIKFITLSYQPIIFGYPFLIPTVQALTFYGCKRHVWMIRTVIISMGILMENSPSYRKQNDERNRTHRNQSRTQHLPPSYDMKLHNWHFSYYVITPAMAAVGDVYTRDITRIWRGARVGCSANMEHDIPREGLESAIQRLHCSSALSFHFPRTPAL